MIPRRRWRSSPRAHRRRSRGAGPGYYRAAADGPYAVVLEGPGEGAGNRLYLDDKLVFDNWKLVRAFQPHTTVQLSAGSHKIVVEDYLTGPIGGKLRVAIADQRTLVSAQGEGAGGEGRCRCACGRL